MITTEAASLVKSGTRATEAAADIRAAVASGDQVLAYWIYDAFTDEPGISKRARTRRRNALLEENILVEYKGRMGVEVHDLGTAGERL